MDEAPAWCYSVDAVNPFSIDPFPFRGKINIIIPGNHIRIEGRVRKQHYDG